MNIGPDISIYQMYTVDIYFNDGTRTILDGIIFIEASEGIILARDVYLNCFAYISSNIKSIKSYDIRPRKEEVNV